MKWIIHKQDENLRYSKVTYTDAMTEWNQWSGYSSLAAEHDTTATDRTEPIPIASHGLVEFISHLFLAHEVSQTIGRNSCVYPPPPSLCTLNVIQATSMKGTPDVRPPGSSSVKVVMFSSHKRIWQEYGFCYKSVQACAFLFVVFVCSGDQLVHSNTSL